MVFEAFGLFPVYEAALQFGLHSSLRQRKTSKCVNTKKAKIGITQPHSPSSVNSFNGSPQNGFFNSGYSPGPRTRSMSENSDAGIDGQFKFLEGYSSPYPEVFTISTGNGSASTDIPKRSEKSEGDSGTLASRGSHPEDKYKWTDTDSVDGTKHRKTKSRKICVILLVTTLVIGLLAGVAVILAFKVFGDKSDEKTMTTIRPDIVTLEGSLDLIETWDPALDDPNSTLYINTANNFTSEMDKLMQNSEFNNSYIRTIVLNFSPGSIKTRFRMNFGPSYKQNAPTDTALARLLQNDIRTRASTTGLNIKKATVFIGAIETLTTSTKEPSTTTRSQSSTYETTLTTSSSTSKSSTESTTASTSTSTKSKQSTLSTLSSTSVSSLSSSSSSTTTTSTTSIPITNITRTDATKLTSQSISSLASSSTSTTSSSTTNTAEVSSVMPITNTSTTPSPSSPSTSTESTTTSLLTSTYPSTSNMTSPTNASTSITTSMSTQTSHPAKTATSTLTLTTSKASPSSKVSTIMSSLSTQFNLTETPTSSSTAKTTTSSPSTSPIVTGTSSTWSTSTTSSQPTQTSQTTTQFTTATSNKSSESSQATTTTVQSTKTSPKLSTTAQTSSTASSTTSSTTHTPSKTTQSTPTTLYSSTSTSQSTSNTSYSLSTTNISSTTSQFISTTSLNTTATPLSTPSSTESTTSPTSKAFTTTTMKTPGTSTISESTSTMERITLSTTSDKSSTTTMSMSHTPTTSKSTSTTSQSIPYSTSIISSSTLISTQNTSTTSQRISTTPQKTSPTTTSSEPSTTMMSTTSTLTTPQSTTTSQKTSTTTKSTPSTTTSSTTTSTTLRTTTARDFPPVANAGQDVSITLPKNTVYLYGNNSRDDVGVVQYQWQKLSSLPADMAGARTSTLYVSNLVPGNYTFQLTVVDKNGQFDRDTVQVTVHEAPTTTTPAPTTTPQPLCLEVTFDTCRSRGFVHTLLPNLLGLMSLDEAKEKFEIESKGVMNQLCQEVALTYLCSLYFPKCDPQVGSMIFPCVSLCEVADSQCSAYFYNPFPCETFSQIGNSSCVQHKTTPAPPVTSTPAPTCEDTLLSDCRNLGFTETLYPNYFHEPNQTTAMVSFEQIFRGALVGPMCSDKLFFFICSVQFPMCYKGKKKGPCRRTCKEVIESCPDYQYFFDCNSYPEIDCMAPPETPAVLKGKTLRRYCRPDEFTCVNVTKCVPNSKQCDGVNDCGDWTDEMDCQCNEYQFQCQMGMCIKLYQRCDGSPQCPDNSDEKECKCSHGQVACPDGECIMSEWLCDGRAECSDAWDEMNCSKHCGINQFICKDHSCIGYDSVCDLKEDCPGGEDEWDCIKQTNGILLLKNKRIWTALCADNWHDEYGDYACNMLGEGAYIGKTDTVYRAWTFFRIPDNSNGDRPSVFGPLEMSHCPLQKAVKINCEPRGCGKPIIKIEKEMIVNGEPAIKGMWPWQVGLYFGGQYFCGGTLIDNLFVLTAAHCVEVYTGNFELLTVKLGAHNREQSEVTQHVVSVEAIKSHKEHVYFERNDIALLQLASPVTYTKYIQPVCLPEPGEPLPLYSQCFTVGWGKTKWDGEYAEVLQQLKMTLWDTQKCNSSIAWNGEVYDTFLCAGYFSGVRSICKGDSGGPLLCMDKYRTWKVVGVSSYVANYCNMTERPNIFTDVRKFLPWIEEKTECKFRCDNERCLYNKEQICNRVNDCGDNSDEIRNCNRSISCDFEDKYLCGYTYDGWKIGYDNKLAQRTTIDGQFHTQSYAPQFDHTVGRYPGHFFYGKEKNYLNGELSSPKFKTTGQTCIRFNYYLRGEISIGFKVQVYEYYGSGKTTAPVNKFVSKKFHDATDEWRMGYFDLTLGEFMVKFLAGDLYQTALDDVKAIPGMCRNVLCDPATEFRCRADVDKCIAKQLHCDLAVECDNAYDELNCQASTNSSYTCDFENGNLCSLRQDVGDLSDWWYVNATFVQGETRDQHFMDHTTGTNSGYLLYLNTYFLQESSHVYMRQMFVLHKKQYCLSFHYQMQTDATFNIHLDCDGCTRETHTAMITYDGWTLFQINLPVVQLLHVTYDVMGTENIGGFYYSFIALDDVHVRSGVCPPYVCPADYTKCRTLNRCIPQSVICDREVNCLDESDEESCVCTANEFRCASGRCITKDKECNKKVDCLDGTDEGATCSALHSVSCTFEHPYMCGYEFLSYTDYTWARFRGTTPTPQTGPARDHTLKNELGYYVYTEANQGSKGDNASIVSPEFYSAVGQSLEYYYHIYSSQPQLALPGVLRVSLNNTETGQMTTMWESDMNLYDGWQSHCIDLPSDVFGKIVFTAIRNESTIYGVDMAIDDVSLRSYTCSETTTTSTTTPTTTTTTIESSTSSGSICGPNKWLCNNGITCIEQSYYCDQFSDCPDGSDELDCPPG